jgi:hypothetical protein
MREPRGSVQLYDRLVLFPLLDGARNDVVDLISALGRSFCFMHSDFGVFVRDVHVVL